MSSGTTQDPRATRAAAAAARIRSGESWDEFCDSLKAAGQVVLSAPDAVDERDRAEGYRYLTRLLRGALETFIEHADPRAPELRRTCHETIKMGADNPDNFYQNAAISGKYTYRVWGNRGSVHDLGFGVQHGNYGATGDLPTSDYLDGSDLITDADGNFEIIVGQEPREGNWLQTIPESRVLNVRQTQSDHKNETLASLQIERIDGAHAPRHATPETIDRGLQGAAQFVTGCAKLFHRWTRELAEHPNALPLFDNAKATAAGGVPHIDYYHGYWTLEEDEALVIDVTPPTCHFWNFQLDNYWMESLDYRYFDVTINQHSATLRADGSLRVVIAATHPAPGDHSINWMDSCGHTQGTMCLRWVHADTKPQPRCRRVRLDEVKDLI